MNTKVRKALITGSSGQDAAYLAAHLLAEGYSVYGFDISPWNDWRIRELGIQDKVKFTGGDVLDMGTLIAALSDTQPDEVYHLASQSFVASSFGQPVAAALNTGVGTINVLEACRHICPCALIYNAATSELFGNGSHEMQNEETPMNPQSPYAIAKMMSYLTAKLYRGAYGMFVVNGILFNHESPLRGTEFVTRKIAMAAASIARGLTDRLALGNIEAKRDWGYAPEYVQSMWLMLQQPAPKDYVIATGEAHSVREFLDLAFGQLDLVWENHVDTSREHLRPMDVVYLCGDASQARKELGWEPKVKFPQLVSLMVQADLKRLR